MNANDPRIHRAALAYGTQLVVHSPFASFMRPHGETDEAPLKTFTRTKVLPPSSECVRGFSADIIVDEFAIWKWRFPVGWSRKRIKRHLELQPRKEKAALKRIRKVMDRKIEESYHRAFAVQAGQVVCKYSELHRCDHSCGTGCRLLEALKPVTSDERRVMSDD